MVSSNFRDENSFSLRTIFMSNRISDFFFRSSNLFNNECISILLVTRVISMINCKRGYERISSSAAAFWFGSIGVQRNFKNRFFGSSMNKNKRPREKRSDDDVFDSEKHFKRISNDSININYIQK